MLGDGIVLLRADSDGLETLVVLVLTVLVVVGMWKVFEKAGQPGWAVLIPIFNVYILLKVADRPAWWKRGASRPR